MKMAQAFAIPFLLIYASLLGALLGWILAEEWKARRILWAIVLVVSLGILHRTAQVQLENHIGRAVQSVRGLVVKIS